MRLIIYTVFFLSVFNSYSQSLTQTNAMDTTEICSHTNSKSIIFINSSDYKIFLNKRYVTRLLRIKFRENNKSLIKDLQFSDTVTFNSFGSFPKDAIIQCLKKGEFTCVIDDKGVKHKTILQVDNFHLVNEELKAKNYSCKREYVEYLFPDKKTTILNRVSHIVPRGL